MGFLDKLADNKLAVLAAAGTALAAIGIGMYVIAYLSLIKGYNDKE